MISMKKMASATALTLVMAAGVAAVATPASARIVCNGYGDCWHTDASYRYGRDVRATYHNDDWYFHQRWDDRYHWRDHHEGRGYYRNGIWITF